MVQQTSKLFAVMRGSGLALFHFDGERCVDDSVRAGEKATLYEPAAPRCGTCNYHADVYSCRHTEGLRIARATDYCPNHSEMAR